MSLRSWKFHTARLLLAGAAVITIGWIIDRPGAAFLAALAAYAAWHIVNVSILYRWLKNPESRAPGSYGIWADIFDHASSMEQQNRQQKEEYQSMIRDFRTLTDAFPDATLVIDDKHNIIWFNKAAGKLLDLKDPWDIGRSVTNLLRDFDFADWLAAPEGGKSRLELTAPGQDNTWLDVSAVSIRDNQRLIILRDVSEVHKVERIRRDFVTNVSHELRTPLTVMLGYLEIFQDRPEDDMTDALRRMHAQAVQMQYMLNDFLELSRLQGVDTDAEERCVDVPAMLVQLREQAEEISRGGHELRFDISPGLKLYGVSADLESAFRNLVVNALKYTPEGGSVSVSWRDTEDGPALKVSDTGIGIPLREIPRLTERFYRVGSDRGRKSGGTGLGLAIVKHVLNAHQSRLEIESEVGVGSTFSCVFPPVRKRN